MQKLWIKVQYPKLWPCYVKSNQRNRDTKLNQLSNFAAAISPNLAAQQIKSETAINWSKTHCSDLMICLYVSLLHSASNVWEMGCVTRTKWVSYRTNTHTHTDTQTYNQLADMFHSACRRIFVARGGVLAMHQLALLQNLSENAIRISDLSNNNQHAQTQYLKGSLTIHRLHYICTFLPFFHHCHYFPYNIWAIIRLYIFTSSTLCKLFLI